MANGKDENSDRWRYSIWYAVERVGLPTVLLMLVAWVFGKPLADTYQRALEAQTMLATRSVESLARIEKCVIDDAAEAKVEILRDIRDIAKADAEENKCEKLMSLQDTLNKFAAGEVQRDEAEQVLHERMLAAIQGLDRFTQNEVIQ